MQWSHNADLEDRFHDYLQQVREEVDQVMGSRPLSEMTWQDVTALHKMEYAVKESERLHPVAHVVMRRAMEDLSFSGYHVPRGTFVMAAPCMSHRMPEVFHDPHAYWPGRFERGTAGAELEANRLIGFGGGVHRCIGVNFARVEIRMVLALLVRHYDMELIDEPRVAGNPMTRWPARPARVQYVPRTGAPEAAQPRPLTPVAAERPSTAKEPSGCPFHGVSS